MSKRGESSQGARLGSTAGPDPNRNPHTTPVLAYRLPRSGEPLSCRQPPSPGAPRLRVSGCAAGTPRLAGSRGRPGHAGAAASPRLGSARLAWAPCGAARAARRLPGSAGTSRHNIRAARRSGSLSEGGGRAAAQGPSGEARTKGGFVARRGGGGGLPAPSAAAPAPSAAAPAPGSPRCAAARLHDAAGTGAAAPAPEVSTKPGYIKFNYNTWLSCNAFYLQISKCFLSIKQASQCPLPSSCGRVCYTLSLFILNAVRRN